MTAIQWCLADVNGFRDHSSGRISTKEFGPQMAAERTQIKADGAQIVRESLVLPGARERNSKIQGARN